MGNYQGFNAELQVLPGGRLANVKRVKLSLGDLWEAKNGVRIFKQGQASGEFAAKGKLLHALLLPLAIAGGSWQKIKPLPGMLLSVTDDDGGTPLFYGLENVAVHIPKEVEFNRLEGNEDEFVFTFDVLGQGYAAGVPVYEHMAESGIGA